MARVDDEDSCHHMSAVSLFSSRRRRLENNENRDRVGGYDAKDKQNETRRNEKYQDPNEKKRADCCIFLSN